MSSAPSEDSVTDPFLLSWGSSVNVNEDLRNSIRAEIHDIEASISNLDGNIQSEQRDADQLAKDLLHAYKEMSSLRRSAAGERDSASMNHQVRSRLVEALRELMTNDPITLSSEKDDENASKDNENENSDQTSSKTVGAYLSGARSEYDESKALLASLKEAFAALKEQLQETRKEKDAIAKRIGTSKLEEELESSEKEVASRLKEQASEVQRKNSTVAAIHQARAETDRYGQLCDDFATSLADDKAKHATEMAELSAKLEALRADTTSLVETGASLASVYEARSAEIDRFADIQDELEAIGKETLVKTSEIENISMQVATLAEKDLKDVTSALEASRTSHAEAIAKQKAARELEITVEDQRAKNDKAEAEAVAANKEHAGLVLEKEGLLEKLAELQSKSDEDVQTEVSKVLSDRTNAIASLTDELQGLEQKHKEASAHRDALMRSKEEADRMAEEEIDALKKALSNDEKALLLAKGQLEELPALIKAKKEEMVRELKDENEQSFLEVERKKKVFRIAGKMLSKADKKVKSLLALSNSK